MLACCRKICFNNALSIETTGEYLYPNHHLIGAFNFDAKAEVNVKGKWNNNYME
jgi:hypothetical protein